MGVTGREASRTRAMIGSAAYHHRPTEYLGTFLFAILVTYFLAVDLRFSMRARHGAAVVLSSHPIPRSGATAAQVDHRTEGGTVRAEVFGWTWHPRDGEVIATVYAPGEPDQPVLDSFVRRHGRAIMAAVFLLAV